jgi:hypothetical protein
MRQVMKGYSKRIWVLMLGIAVAVIIAAALLLNNSPVAFHAPQGTQKLSPPSPAQLIKKTLEKIDLSVIL